SIVPASATTDATPARTESSSVTSRTITFIFKPSAAAASASRPDFATDRIDAKTVSPRRANSSADSRPQPLLHPGIRTLAMAGGSPIPSSAAMWHDSDKDANQLLVSNLNTRTWRKKRHAPTRDDIARLAAGDPGHRMR